MLGFPSLHYRLCWKPVFLLICSHLLNSFSFCTSFLIRTVRLLGWGIFSSSLHLSLSLHSAVLSNVVGITALVGLILSTLFSLNLWLSSQMMVSGIVTCDILVTYAGRWVLLQIFHLKCDWQLLTVCFPNLLKHTLFPYMMDILASQFLIWQVVGEVFLLQNKHCLPKFCGL